MKIIQNTLKCLKKIRVGPKKVGSVGFPETRHFFFGLIANINWRCLIHISLASFLWDIGKQNSPRCDAAKHKNEKLLLKPLKIKMDSSK